MNDKEKKAIEQFSNLDFDIDNFDCKKCVFQEREDCIGCIDYIRKTILNLIEKQKAEIERLKNIISNTSVQFINDTIKTDKKNKEDIESLNAVWKIELEKKDKEISKLKNNNKDLLRKLRNRVKEVTKLEKYSLYKKEFSRLNKQLQNKDKIIDLMAEKFEDLKLAYFKKEDGGEFMGKYRTYNKNEWKQYFERKVEEDK